MASNDVNDLICDLVLIVANDPGVIGYPDKNYSSGSVRKRCHSFGEGLVDLPVAQLLLELQLAMFTL